MNSSILNAIKKNTKTLNEIKSFLLGTERSGAAQRCLPSTTGSASAAAELSESKCVSEPVKAQRLESKKAGDETGVVNSVVQLPVSGSAAVIESHKPTPTLYDLVREWETAVAQNRTTEESCKAERNVIGRYFEGMADALERCAIRLECRIGKPEPRGTNLADDDPQRSGVKRRKLNVCMSHGGHK